MADLLSAIHHHIDAHLEEHIARIQEFLRQPSVSAESADSGEGEEEKNRENVAKCAELLRSYFEELGCAEAEIVETARHPAVWAYLDAGAPVTIANYCMYDTQPADRQEDWISPPFAANLRDQPEGRVVIARGAFNSKGPVRAWLNALQSVIAVAGKPPVNIMFVCEGEEELGSPHLQDVVARCRDRLAHASALIEFVPTQDRAGRVQFNLGYKGNVYFELECSSVAWGRGARRDVHSRLRSILDNPAQHLVGALASLVGADGTTPAIEGLAAEIRPWPEDLKLIHELAQDPTVVDALKTQNDVIAWIPGLDEPEILLRQYLYGAAINVNGMQAGFTGKGATTIIPERATAKLNIRLVPDQTPDGVMRQVRVHLDRHGYDDIVIRAPEGSGEAERNYTGYTWSKMRLDAPAVQAVLDIYRQRGVPVQVWPHSAGSTPKSLFSDPPLNLPICTAGLGHGGREHSANEFFVIESSGPYGGLADFEKLCVDTMYGLANRLQRLPRSAVDLTYG